MKNFERYFKQFIHVHYPQDFANLMIRDIAREFDTIKPDVNFASTSQNLVDRRLVFTSYFLAFIKVMEKRGESYEKIREISLQIVMEYVRPKNRIQKFLKVLPVALLKTRMGSMLVKAFERRVSKAGHPDGFVVKIITDKNETYGLGYGIDILECGICKLFNKHGYSQYARILCEVDEITSGLAGLQLFRSGTIANGAAKCDFRWKAL
jgi:hypothetical protein